ncbi:MAG: carbon-nitrogen hydrolase family protein [Pseudomonadota bacterium]
MKIAVLQGPKISGDVSDQLKVMAEKAKAAAASGARLLILPEMFLTGYHIGPDAVGALAEPADGPSAAKAASIAAEHGIALLYGYPERGDDGRIYNSALLLDADGSPLANHRKTHLFGDIDKQAFSAGDGPLAIAELDGLKLGILICYDVEFPENTRLLALEGVELIAVPTALMAPYDFIADNLVRARAYENQLFLAYANRTGQEQELTYLGKSSIIAPDGEALARAGGGEDLILADLDMQRLQASRRINTYFADRRPELYAPLAAEGQAL